MADNPARQPVDCGFCGELARWWPDSCPGDPPDDHCLEVIEFKHDIGDHRRCSITTCSGAAMVAEVSRRGAEVATRAEKRWAVVDTFTEPWRFASSDHLGWIKQQRTRWGREHGARFPFEYKDRVLIVRDDGVVA